MFAAHLRQAYRTCDKIFVRTLRGRGSGFVPRGSNPGLDSRISAFRKEGFQITDNDAKEFVEQSESEFYKVGEVYNEHLNETLMGKHETRHKIVKDKYFKENMPNLLTWSEKEQIRHLHNEHPDEWTLEKLSESFPVTIPVLKRLIKYPWKPASEQRILRHDANVMRNWREIKEGSLDISDDLRQQFLKFSDRTIPPLKKSSIKIDKIDLTQEEKMGEFESIVKRCATQAQARNNTNNTQDASHDTTNEQPHVKKDSKRVTLEALTTKIKNRMEKGKEVNLPDQLILNTVNANSGLISQSDANVDLSIQTDEPKEVAKFAEENSNEKSILEYPERVRIPKSAYKKGATYKVNDCYYDHDGKFLYRVLGMSNN